MRVDTKKLDEMFAIAGISREKLHEILIALGKSGEKATGEVPPFPSLSEYDAKVWRFIKQYASKGALFWNVA